MITQLPMEALHLKLGARDLIPQAILNTPLSYFSDHLGIQLESDADDLDAYQGAAILIDDHFPVAIKHHSGYPTGTVTIYLPSDVSGVEDITRIIRMILRKLELSGDSIAWERQMEPDL
jgi:hypothetical protein